MDLVFSLSLLQEHNLTPNEYLYMYIKHTNIQHPLPDIPQDRLIFLQNNDWLRLTNDGVVLRNKFQKVFSRYLEVNIVDSWIDEWRSLWPSSVKTGGRPVRGSKAGCLKKMKSFTAKNPQFTKEQIFDATKSYLFEKSREGYKFISSADYFIEKDGISLLESLIEHYQERGDTLKTIGNIGGLFHKEI